MSVPKRQCHAIAGTNFKDEGSQHTDFRTIGCHRPWSGPAQIQSSVMEYPKGPRKIKKAVTGSPLAWSCDGPGACNSIYNALPNEQEFLYVFDNSEIGNSARR